jgi:hypothetical protein
MLAEGLQLVVCSSRKASVRVGIPAHETLCCAATNNLETQIFSRDATSQRHLEVPLYTELKCQQM